MNNTLLVMLIATGVDALFIPFRKGREDFARLLISPLATGGGAVIGTFVGAACAPFGSLLFSREACIVC